MKKEEALSLAKLRYIEMKQKITSRIKKDENFKAKTKKDFEELKNYLKKHNLIKERK
ncbi:MULTISPECIES: hypothetical protein [unclassified Lebetimonas]|uniref:hypothetical protein n=1 Tax=unclassified Lebetimonas TaxID=2648158 RepID=UPI0004BB917E|nr:MULTISPECIES: hypothetical protein [unclassified Lebetimonas]